VLCHVVLFRIPSDAPDTAQRKLRKALEEFLAGSEDVDSWSVSSDLVLRPGHPRAYDILLKARFEDASVFQRYLRSSSHQVLLRDVIAPMGVAIASIQVRCENRADYAADHRTEDQREADSPTTLDHDLTN